jgi:hypothetical protein
VVQGKEVHRITFSKQLAEHTLKCIEDPLLSLARVTLKIGNEIGPDQDSPTGIYALVDRQRGNPLRVTMDKEQANLICDFTSRHLAVAFISKVVPMK